MAIRSNKNVRGLDVPMDDPFRMRYPKRVGNLNRQVEQRLGFDWLTADSMLERLTFQKFQDDKRLALGLADFVNRADVRVI